jgi:hypothetical protein
MAVIELCEPILYLDWVYSSLTAEIDNFPKCGKGNGVILTTKVMALAIATLCLA